MTKDDVTAHKGQEMAATEATAPTGYSPSDFLATDPLGEVTETRLLVLNVSVGRPRKDWVWVHPAPEFQRPFYMLNNEQDGWYIVHPKLKDVLRAEPSFYRCTVYTYTTFGSGLIGFWPIPLPGPDGDRTTSAETQELAALAGMKAWIKIKWNGKLYEVREAPGKSYENPPDWTERLGGKDFDGLFEVAFRQRQILDLDHAIIKQILGID